MEPINFKATIHGLRIDREGEGKLTLTIPSSDLPKLIQCVTGLETVLNVSIEPEVNHASD